ncbi:MAG: SVM family protein ['Conium maculatum' witches'-broom phytoplasma]|nr:SVM family protein ['Conium maculatum' witches'-broom phytoplasma]
MIKLKKHFKPIYLCLIAFLGILFIFVNNSLIAAPNEEFVRDMRIVNCNISSLEILKKNPSFQKYFDFKQEKPCYNANLAEASVMWQIKNPPTNLLGVYFDGFATRSDEDKQYTLEELKQMGNGSKNMYIFWKNN